MKLMRVIGISLGLAVFVSLCACKDDTKGLRQNQNPPQPVPGPNTGFVTDPPADNSDTDTPQDNPPKTDTVPEGS